MSVPIVERQPFFPVRAILRGRRRLTADFVLLWGRGGLERAASCVARCRSSSYFVAAILNEFTYFFPSRDGPPVLAVRMATRAFGAASFGTIVQLVQ